MTSLHIEDDSISVPINGRHHDNISEHVTPTNNTKTDNKRQSDLAPNRFKSRETTPIDNGYKSEGSPLSGDVHVTSSNHGYEEINANSQQNVDWKGGVRYSNLLNSSGGWPLAEGSLRHGVRDFDDKSGETETFFNNSGSSNGGFNKVTKHCGTEDEYEDDEEDKTKFKFKNLTKNQKVILVATSATNLLSFLSLSILGPFFPLEADKKGVNGTIAGWIFGVFALVQFLSSPVFGRFLPIIGSKFTYIAGLFVACVCTFLFGILDLVPHQDGVELYVTLCFVVRIMLALGCTAISNAGFVMLVKAFPDNVATVFGIGEIFTGVGMVTGPAMGGFLYSAGGFVLPFAIIGGCLLIALPLIWISIPPQDDSLPDSNSDMSIWKLVFQPKSAVNSVVVIFAASIWAILDPTLEPHLRVYGFGPELVGVLFLIMAAVYSVTSPIWGTLADRLPDNRALLIPGFLAAAIGCLLIGPSPALGFSLSFNELWLTIVSLIILGVASSLAVIPTYDIYIDVLAEIDYPENTRTYGMVSGLWVSMYALGDFLGPSLGGFLNDEVGFEWMMTGVAGACLATAILICVSWFIEAKCCNKKKPLFEVVVPNRRPSVDQSERDPLLISASTVRGTPPEDGLRSYSSQTKHTSTSSAF